MCRKHTRSRSALFGFVRFLFLFYEFATAFNEFFIVVVYRAGIIPERLKILENAGLLPYGIAP